MSFLGNVIGFEGFHGKRLGQELMKDPSRLLTGVDPASTGLWNTVLGTHNHALVDQMGGATGKDYQAARAAGIDTTAGQDVQDLAHVVAAAYATAGLAGAAGGMGGAGAGGAADGGSVNLFADAVPGAGGDVGASALPGAVTTSSGFGGVGMDPSATGFNGASVDPALAGDNIDAGGGWNPASGGSGGGFNYQQMLGKALNQMGQQKQQQGQGGGSRQNPVNLQPGNVPWNFMGGM